MIAAHSAEAKNRQKGSPLEVLMAFLKPGVTCFGGPIAHIGYLAANDRFGSKPAVSD
jgi:chromate transporter